MKCGALKYNIYLQRSMDYWKDLTSFIKSSHKEDMNIETKW